MKTNHESKKQRRQEPRQTFTGRQKSEAVLSVWSARRKPSEVCRQLQIHYGTLHSWQKQALEAMLAALEPAVQTQQSRGPALGADLEKLLERASQRVAKLSKLEQRLEKIQKEAIGE